MDYRYFNYFSQVNKNQCQETKTKKNWHETYAKSSSQENSQVNLDDTSDRRALSQLHFSTLCLGLFSTFPNFFHQNKPCFLKSEIFFTLPPPIEVKGNPRGGGLVKIRKSWRGGEDIIGNNLKGRNLKGYGDNYFSKRRVSCKFAL